MLSVKSLEEIGVGRRITITSGVLTPRSRGDQGGTSGPSPPRPWTSTPPARVSVPPERCRRDSIRPDINATTDEEQDVRMTWLLPSRDRGPRLALGGLLVLLAVLNAPREGYEGERSMQRDPEDHRDRA